MHLQLQNKVDRLGAYNLVPDAMNYFKALSSISELP